ncbi:MAG: aminoacyl-tRNA hydrolase [Patescibacteria group bacterium]
MYIIVGLGNPGTEYTRTRHNAGRMATDFMVGKVEETKTVTPDTFMNKIGSVVAKVIKSKKSAKKLIIIHDDLALPLGVIKISYNRGSGGHKGVESIIQALKTKEFIRIRIGISPQNKPSGESAVEKHILGEFKKSEMEILTKVFARVQNAIEVIVKRGFTSAMTEFNK